MKRFLVFVTLFFILFSGNAATKTWIGVSGGLWSVGTNWSPTGVPGAGDDLIFNTSVTVNVDAAGPFAVNTMTFTSNSTVIFSTPGTRNFRFSSMSTLNPALKIDAGSTFTFDATNAGTNNSTLDLGFGGVGVIASIYGTLNITSSGGSSAGIRLDTYTSATNYGILTVYNGGIIRVGFNTNTTVSSLTPTPTINMLNGSLYESLDNGGSFPTGNWEPTSIARALSPGANVPQFNGTTYGNLEWNCPAQNNFSLSNDLTFNNVNFINTNGATAKVFRIINSSALTRILTINGDLTISSSSILEITGAGTTAPGGGKLHLLGNLNNSGTILTSGVVSTVNDFELDGTSNQNITNTGLLSGARLSFIMNNAAGATLLTPVTLPYKLTLTSGKINTTSTNVLSMVTGGTVSGGSSTSFVEGPMKKGGSDNFFTFPIGVGSIYSPATYFSASLIATDTVRAEYVRGNPQTTYGANYDPTPLNPYTLNHISFVEYWKLQKMTGATVSHNVTLFFTQYSFCKVFATTFVSSYHPATIWQSCGINGISTNQTGSSGPYVFGYISTTGQSLDDSIFTLGTSDPYGTNPLPIDLITFDASKLTNTKSSINWELAACCSAAAKFEIQRANTDKKFTTISTIGGSETNKLYSYIDNGLKNGVNYYRLRMIDADGKIAYSRIVAIMNGVDGLLLTSLVPTIVTNNTSLTIASSNQQKLDIVIVDMQGRIMMKHNYTIAAGNTNIELELSRLAAGVYQLTGISAEGKTNTIRFVKQ